MRLIRRFIIVVCILLFAALICAYLLFSPRFNSKLVNMILFHPNQQSEHDSRLNNLSGVPAEEVFFKAGAQGPMLNGIIYKVPESKTIVLFSHGNAASLDCRIDKLRAIIDSGSSVFAYDYRGYGRSEGVPTLPGLIEDSDAAYDYLINERHYKPESIVLYGESLGTGISTSLARRADQNQQKIKGIVLESGFASLEALAKQKLALLSIYPSFLFTDPPLDNVAYVKDSHPPLLIIAGAKDTTIPYEQNGKVMFEQAKDPKALFVGPNSSHNVFSLDFAAYKLALSRFLKSLDASN